MAELAIPDPCVVLLVGAAGAGKSTFAARHFPPSAILSSDAIREAITGDAADQRLNRAAFAALHRALERRLARGSLAVVDATNATAAARREIRAIAAGHGVPVVAIVLDLPAALVHERNVSRPGRQVPKEVVARQLGAVRAILDTGRLASEGYADIVIVRDRKTLDRLTVRLVPSAGSDP
ncbi:MAG: AAA family ATPase [Chloroflexota bacterium]